MSNQDKRYYDEEEKSLIDSIENGEWKQIDNKENKLEEAVDTANKTIRKEKRMNIRISERDLKNLKIKALEEGIPYQTLVSMILHKYVTGKLKESA